MERLSDLARHSSRQHHVKPKFANAPGNQVSRLRNHYGTKAVHPQPHRLGADETGSTTVSEDQEGQDLVQFLRLLKMQGAEFKVQYQHNRPWLRADNMPRHLQRIDRGITTHKSDHGSLNRWIQSKVVDDLEV